MKQKIHIKDYQVHLPPLGEGTFGTVYRATYRGISERALKLFKPEAVDLSAIARELEKLSSVAEHRGIVTLHDFDLLTNTPYYAMSLHADELEDGTWRSRTLEDVCGKLDSGQNAVLIDQIAAALAYLHRHQVLHCDVKPTNVMLTDESPGRIKICDFGQSRGSNLASTDAAGTPLYSSPEQLIAPNESADGRGLKWDVYSFGVLAFKLITGRLPRLQGLVDGGTEEDFEATILEASSLEASLQDRTSGNANRIAELLQLQPEIEWPADAKIDSRRKAIISRCLELDPGGRPTDMREVRNEVVRLDQERRAIRSRNWSLLFGSISILAIVAFGWALFAAQQTRKAIQSEKQARAEAEELVNFIIVDLRESLSRTGQMELLDHIAEKAEGYISGLPKDLETMQSLRVFAQGMQTRGDLALSRGAYDSAIESFGKSYNIYSQLSSTGEVQPRMNFLAGEVLTSIGEAHRRKGETDLAMESFEQALELRDPKTPSGTTPELYLRSTADIHARRAGILAINGELSTAIIAFEKALALMQEVVDLPIEVFPAHNSASLVNLHNALGDIHRQADRNKDARQSFETAIETGRANLGEPDESRLIQAGVAKGLHILGEMELEKKELLEALFYFRQELILREGLRRAQSGIAEWMILLAECHASVALCYDLESANSRDLAVNNYRLAIRYLESWKGQPALLQERENRIEAYREAISRILEMDE